MDVCVCYKEEKEVQERENKRKRKRKRKREREREKVNEIVEVFSYHYINAHNLLSPFFPLGEKDLLYRRLILHFHHESALWELLFKFRN